MFKLEEIPFWAWITFSMAYFSIGNKLDPIWSGCYFCMNYILIIWAFLTPKTKRIKTAGVSLAVSLLIFSVIKFFVYTEIERFCIFILFLISIAINIYLQIKRK